MYKANKKGKATRGTSIEELVNAFNAKIEKVSAARPDIAEIQPLKRSIGYINEYWGLDTNARKRARNAMLAYLKEGAEERSSSYTNMTQWAAAYSRYFTKQANKSKTAGSKAVRSSLIYDIDKREFTPDFANMSPEEAKRALYALEKEGEQGKELPEQYKENYLAAIANEVGVGYLYRLAENLPAELLVEAYYNASDIMDFEFMYGQDNRAIKQSTVINYLEEYIRMYGSKYNYKGVTAEDFEEYEKDLEFYMV